MFNNIIAAVDGSNWVMFVILGAFFVLMMVMSIVPQRKRQKQMQEMMSNLSIGTKVMTIGRMVGKIVALNSETNQVILNVGTDENPTLITMDKAGVGYVMDKNEAVVSNATAAEENKDETKL